MANTTTDLVKAQSGVLTVGSTDLGAILDLAFTITYEDYPHKDISDGNNQTDLFLSSISDLRITGKIEEVASIDKLAMAFGAGTATDSKFQVAVNTTEYAVQLVFTLQDGGEIQYTHSKYRFRASALDTGGSFLAVPFELIALKHSAGDYGPLGEFEDVAAS